MRTTCENCRTVYDAPEDDSRHAICPVCDHANRAGAAETAPEPEDDPLKTMVVPIVASAPERPAGARRALPSNAKLELIVAVPGSPEVHHVLEGPRTTIGRGLCDLRINDAEVSREHCAIVIRDEVAVLEDLKSANGTLLNGALVSEHPIQDGDEIQVGSTVLRVRALAGD